ncbi:MAG: glycosyltransferase [bacterium]
MARLIKVHILFLGNPFHDSRIVNLSNSLKADGCEVRVTAFDWMDKNFVTVKGGISVFKLVKRKFSLPYYLRFYSILFAETKKYKADILFAEDVHCLPVAAFFSKIRKSKLFYNSRELYAYLGGLRNKKFVQSIVKFVEKSFIRKCDLVLTTGEMDSEFLEKFYGIKNTVVIRNIPLLQQPTKIINFRELLPIEADKTILLYQGVMLDGRGIELIFRALSSIKNSVLVLLGDGPKKQFFEMKAKELNLTDRVFFMGSIPQNELINYTAGAEVGFALIENISVSYYYALPNKLFEYIMAGLPIVSSNLPQMKKIIEKYDLGIVIDLEKSEDISAEINDFINDKARLEKYRLNCVAASQELNWQNEYNRAKSKLLNIN